MHAEKRPSLYYLYDNGPDILSPEKVIALLETQTGIFLNCQAFVNTAEFALGHEIPPYKSSERLFDPGRVYRDILFPDEPLKTGDILGFSPTYDQDPKKIHLGIARVHPEWGTHILHASKDTMRVTKSTLPEMTDNPKYAAVRFMKRAKYIYEERINVDALMRLGFLS